MAITRQQKEAVLEELVEKFQKAQSVAFGRYSGMSVAQLSEMRKEMRAQNVEFKVAKKTLFKLAAAKVGVELSDDIMEGTIGAAISYADVVSGPKILKTTSKKVEVVKLLGGMMDGKMVSIVEMQTLADLPSKEQLLAKFMGMMQSPIRSFAGLLQAPSSSFARTLTALAEKKAA